MAFILTDIASFVRQRLSDKRYKVDDILGSTNHKLLERLTNWIPPDAYIDDNNEEIAADLRAILNTGWLRYLCLIDSQQNNIGDKNKMNEHLKEIDALLRLLLKSIEYSNLRVTWDKIRKED